MFKKLVLSVTLLLSVVMPATTNSYAAEIPVKGFLFTHFDPQTDSDNDGLTDYEEINVYETDPQLEDTDDDGVPDGDWWERREYIYSVRFVAKIRPPFDIAAMDDFYQDVKVLLEKDNAGYTWLEVLLFPDITPAYDCMPYPSENYPSELTRYLEPHISANYSPEMQQEVREIVEGSATDCEVFTTANRWVNENTKFFMDHSVPEIFFTRVDENGNVYMTHQVISGYTAPEILENQYFVDSMFKNRVHGTCSSIANLKCGILRAAGVPCRLIQTVTPNFSNVAQAVPYKNDMTVTFLDNFENVEGNRSANHVYIEVYLNGLWIRADQHINIMGEESDALYWKLFSVADWSEVDHTTWDSNWAYNRPFYTMYLEDYFGLNDPRYSIYAHTNVDLSESTPWYVFANGNVNIRSCGSTSCDIVDTLSPGTKINLTETSGGWHQVSMPDGNDAFVAVWLTMPFNPYE